MTNNSSAKGSCNCGKVTFEVTEKLTDVYVCHCSICRKSTGSSGIAVTVVKNESFRWLSGQEYIRSWAKPGHDWAKKFCSHCGSPLPDNNDDERMYVPVSLLDSGYENLAIKQHMFVGSKAPWDDIGSLGEQHDEHIK